jgi:small subunit ribosomal protein S20
MPNKKAAIKGLRQSEKNRERNIRVKTNVKFHLAKVEQLIKEGKTKEAIEALRAFQKAADKAAKGNVISPNKANRKKSALMKKISVATKK